MTERVIELDDIPQSDPGAPQPVVYATESSVLLAYYLSRKTAEAHNGHKSGLIVFGQVNAHLFGSPNDEALRGHRLWEAGLRSYAAYRVENSEWVSELCARNRVHPYHDDKMYAGVAHYIFTFHDTTFEAAARSIAVSTRAERPKECIGKIIEGRDGLPAPAVL